MGKMWTTDMLPFSHLKRVAVRKSWGEIGDSYYLQLFNRSDSVWATLPGYQNENQAASVRQKMLAFIQKTTGGVSTEVELQP